MHLVPAPAVICVFYLLVPASKDEKDKRAGTIRKKLAVCAGYVEDRAAVWFNSYKRRVNVVTAGQLSSVESSVSYWRPEAVNY